MVASFEDRPPTADRRPPKGIFVTRVRQGIGGVPLAREHPLENKLHGVTQSSHGGTQRKNFVYLCASFAFSVLRILSLAVTSFK
jgi:hypothetical protein